MTTTNYSFRLTEEIARWAFEVHVSSKKDWEIVFTNPTAGPWKRLMASDAKGAKGEVHRFEREEDRPDLVLVSDKHKILLIIEAKDSLEKLCLKDQIKKSSDVAVSLTKILSKKEKNSHWGNRSHYSTLVGLLWGATEKTTDAERITLFELYAAKLKSAGLSNISPVIFGVESNKLDGAIKCAGYLSKDADITTGVQGKTVLASLGL